MARYVDDYRGIIGHDVPGRGMDPNWRGPYGGMRMRGGYGQAAYGAHRLYHPDDFESAGGFTGQHGRGGPHRGAYGADYPAPARGYDRGWGSGGVRDIRHDRALLHDFNAHSPGLERGGRYDREHHHPVPEGGAQWGWGRRGPLGYSNRGLTDAGYSEGWAWGPMRGAR